MNNKFRWTNGRGLAVGAILVAALVGFEMFNFDTTKYALRNLFGELRFIGLEWAGILAFAFCSIDFAGLVRMFTPEQGLDEPKEVWLLTGAWLLGATMNAVMTWYAVSLVVATRFVGVGNLSQEKMLSLAPVFVAVLVWLTRILFIGSLSVAADRLAHPTSGRRPSSSRGPARYPAQSRANGPVEQRHQDDLFGL